MDKVWKDYSVLVDVVTFDGHQEVIEELTSAKNPEHAEFRVRNKIKDFYKSHSIWSVTEINE